MELREYRDKMGLTQAEVAEKLKLDTSTISKYESGKLLPSIEVLARIDNFTAGLVRLEDFVDLENT